MEGFKITLKAARINAGLTAKNAAERIEKTEKTILNWENAKTPISAESFYDLCKIYGIDPDYVRVPTVNDDSDFFYN